MCITHEDEWLIALIYRGWVRQFSLPLALQESTIFSVLINETMNGVFLPWAIIGTAILGSSALRKCPDLAEPDLASGSPVSQSGHCAGATKLQVSTRTCRWHVTAIVLDSVGAGCDWRKP